MKIFTALFFAVSLSAAAQTIQVPHKMDFAGMTLTIRDDARREIQKDVDALTRSPKHFTIKAEKAKTYFPIIEKIFRDEGVPEDFKYLVLQESSLVADAVSVSNAVGFWQFKDFTALEMGLRVDKQIDERMNIASSTRAAARYIKKNNLMFNNWIYALQAYQMGAGGVSRSEKNIRNGATHEEITSSTYWYVKKFLAHKVAYEQAVKGTAELPVTVFENRSNKTLAELARELSIDEAELRNYNKWIRSSSIPDDRIYVVLIPGMQGSSFETLPSVVEASRRPLLNPSNEVKAVPSADQQSLAAKINGVNAIQALPGDTPAKMASRAHVDLTSFLKWNEISYSTPIVTGTFYFLAKKRSKAQEDFHTTSTGENLWIISQKYGVTLKKLKKYNRIDDDQVQPGSTVWLSSNKPRSKSKEVPQDEVAQVNQAETFGWETTPLVTASSETIAIEGNTIAPDTAAVKSEVGQLADSIENIQLTNVSEVSADTAQTELSVVMNEIPEKGVTPVEIKGEHIVQPKETLYAIAKIYGIGVMDLVNWNNLDLQQGIKIGQVLKVKSVETVVEPKNSAPQEFIHEVSSSDTLYSIARKYGVTIKDLMDWNEKKDFSVSVGEKLKIKQAQ
jgi:membrane-bound lytic murein transglycosylase D